MIDFKKVLCNKKKLKLEYTVSLRNYFTSKISNIYLHTVMKF